MRHPSKSLVGRYAAGGLAPGPGLTVGVHLASCAECAAQALEVEEAEGRLLQSTADAPLREGALEQAMANLDAPAPRRRPVPAISNVTIPEVIAEIGVRPRRWLFPQMWVAHLDMPRDDGWRTYLIHAPAGLALPHHGHSGDEYVAVLSGALDDRLIYSVGDFIENPRATEHDLTVADDGTCLCLVSTQGALRWHGVNRLVGLILDI